LSDGADGQAGKYVKIALESFPKFVGRNIRAPHHYYTSTEMVKQWSEVTGKQLEYVQISREVTRHLMPPNAFDELFETFQLMAAEGYYNGANVEEADSSSMSRQPLGRSLFSRTR
jgi:hypothetical protein